MIFWQLNPFYMWRSYLCHFRIRKNSNPLSCVIFLGTRRPQRISCKKLLLEIQWSLKFADIQINSETKFDVFWNFSPLCKLMCSEILTQTFWMSEVIIGTRVKIVHHGAIVGNVSTCLSRFYMKRHIVFDIDSNTHSLIHVPVSSCVCCNRSMCSKMSFQIITCFNN